MQKRCKRDANLLQQLCQHDTEVIFKRCQHVDIQRFLAQAGMLLLDQASILLLPKCMLRDIKLR